METTKTATKIGFIGLGHMGGNMAARFLAAGYAVNGMNRNRESARQLERDGLRWSETPREVGDASDVVFTSLPDDDALEAVASGPDGLLAALRPGKTWVDMSTVSPVVIVRRSASGYRDTVARLSEAIERRGLTVFGRIDHTAAARELDLELADEEVVVFSNPWAGTPLMRSDPRIGIELPLRILVWADADGALLGYRDPSELAGDYDVAQHESTLKQMATLVAELSDEAAGAEA